MHVKTSVPTLKGVLQTYGFDLQARIGSLQQRVEALTKEVAALRQTLTSSKHRVLLGEVALTLDKAVSRFVMQEQGLGCTVAELKQMARDGELQPEQLQRWQQFSGFVQGRGWPWHKLLAQSRELKELLRGDAHSTQEEKARVSTADLIQWVQEEELEEPEQCRRFVQLLSEFGEERKPLLPMSDVSGVLAV